MAEDPKTLEAYLRGKGARVVATAWCCSLPPEVLAQIETLYYDRGIRAWKAVCQWLQEAGYAEANMRRIAYHFEQGHPRVRP